MLLFGGLLWLLAAGEEGLLQRLLALCLRTPQLLRSVWLVQMGTSCGGGLSAVDLALGLAPAGWVSLAGASLGQAAQETREHVFALRGAVLGSVVYSLGSRSSCWGHWREGEDMFSRHSVPRFPQPSERARSRSRPARTRREWVCRRGALW
ncbi:hypothetical protein FN846DRAFT_947654 [Sphaerosporella brunnea]|uniref:Uncharacterized protein n=1 Tax=Sphaerosporella brunnea TaxID=1250544 RepID=A0A5J5EXP9_9PEZI|nr:hypothetical protein FN846DRAFT_947654 [Sphaerosporella brunnea]